MGDWFFVWDLEVETRSWCWWPSEVWYTGHGTYKVQTLLSASEIHRFQLNLPRRQGSSRMNIYIYLCIYIYIFIYTYIYMYLYPYIYIEHYRASNCIVQLKSPVSILSLVWCVGKEVWSQHLLTKQMPNIETVWDTCACRAEILSFLQYLKPWPHFSIRQSSYLLLQTSFKGKSWRLVIRLHTWNRCDILGRWVKSTHLV